MNPLTNDRSMFTLEKLLAIALVFFTFVWGSYLVFAGGNIVGSDQYQLILAYESIVSGQESILSLWESKGGHRYPGYQLLFFGNIYFLGFSPRAESLVAIIFFAIAAFFVIRTLMNGLSGDDLHKLIFAALAIGILFSGQNFRLSTYSLIAMRFFDFAGFVLVCLLTYRFVNLEGKGQNKPVDLLLFVFSVLVCIVFFGRGWGVAAALAIIGTVWINVASHGFHRAKVGRGLFGTLFILFALIVYFYGLRKTGSTSSFDLMGIVQYYFIKLGFANISMISSYWAKNPLLCNVFTILYLSSFIAICCKLVFFARINKSDWLALFLVLFSIASAGLVTMSRFETSPFFPRHNFELSVGLVGLVYLLIQHVSIGDARLNSSFKLIFTGMLAGLLAMNTARTVWSYKYVQNHNDNIEKAFEKLFVKDGTREDFRYVGCRLSEEKCEQIFSIMRNRQILVKFQG